MNLVLILAAAVSIWQSVSRESNSRAASTRGARAYTAQNYDASAKAFHDAAALAPSPQNSFNLGTAQVAAGRRAEGSAMLTDAMRDPSLRAVALYNRGNSALATKAYEHAIRDYSDALRLRPGNAQTKRNLEIALAQLQAMRRQAGGSQQQPKPGSSPRQQPQPEPSAKQEKQQEGDAEALLRSVQQQEQEELARMKRARASRVRVGW